MFPVTSAPHSSGSKRVGQRLNEQGTVAAIKNYLQLLSVNKWLLSHAVVDSSYLLVNDGDDFYIHTNCTTVTAKILRTVRRCVGNHCMPVAVTIEEPADELWTNLISRIQAHGLREKY